MTQRSNYLPQWAEILIQWANNAVNDLPQWAKTECKLFGTLSDLFPYATLSDIITGWDIPGNKK